MSPSGLAASIVRADPVEFWFWVVLGGLAAAACFTAAFYALGRKRTIENTPTSRVRSAAQGYVELIGHGQLMPGQPIVAPLTGLECTWYSYRVEQRTTDYVGGRRRSRWRTVQKGTSTDLFNLVDGTGACVIDPEGAAVTPSESDVWYGNHPQPDRGPAATGGAWALLGLGSQPYRYREQRMRPGDPLYAIGLFKTLGGAGGGGDVNLEVRELVREWKQNTEALLARFDRNRDGTFDMAEWGAVREAARREVLASHAEREQLPPVNLMGKTGDPRRPYLLSALGEHRLVKRYRWYAAALLCTFLVGGSALVWAIGVRLAA